MTLYIDTTGFKEVIFALAGKEVFRRSYKIDPYQSHETLQKFEKFLKSSKFKIESIKKIVVNKGPGSFTGVRVGIAHALALGFALGITIKFVGQSQFKRLV